MTALEPLPALASIAAQRCGVAGLAALRLLALARHLTRLALAGNPCVAGLSPRRRRVLIGNLLPGVRLSERRLVTAGSLPQARAHTQDVAWCSVQPRCSQHAMAFWCWRCALVECSASVLNVLEKGGASIDCIMRKPAI